MMRLAHPYFEVKELIESKVLEASRRGLPVVIANPTYCLGPWDLHDRQLCTIPLLLRGEIPSSITQRLNVIDVRDVAAAIGAALDAEYYGTPIQMSGHDISTEDLYSLICELGRVTRPRISTAATLAVAGAYAMELMLGAVGEKTPLPSGGMPAGRYRSSALHHDLFLKPSSMLSIGIARLAIAEPLRPGISFLFSFL
jgi:nucleoside-diphosphate-sugar epimerase